MKPLPCEFFSVTFKIQATGCTLSHQSGGIIPAFRKFGICITAVVARLMLSIRSDASGELAVSYYCVTNYPKTECRAFYSLVICLDNSSRKSFIWLQAGQELQPLCFCPSQKDSVFSALHDASLPRPGLGLCPWWGEGAKWEGRSV